MPFGLAVSIFLHAALLAWAIFSFKAVAELPAPETPAIAIDLITPSELLRLKQGSEQSKELEAKAKDTPEPDISKKEAEIPKPVVAPPPAAEPPPPEQVKPEPEPPKPVEVAKAEPPPTPEPPKVTPAPDPIAEKLAEPPPPAEAPGPTPDEQKAIQDKLEQDRKLEDQKKAEEEKKKEEEKKRKAEEKKKADEKKKKLAEQKRKDEAKKKFDADRIAALLDKTPDKKGAPQSSTPPTKPTDYKGPTAGVREGKDSVLSAREQDLLKGQISSQLRGCWRLPGGGGGIETTVVTLRWRLKPDGTLDGEPVIDGSQNGAVFAIAAEAAIRAVKQCAPFNLPSDKYTSWRSIIWDFDPREML